MSTPTIPADPLAALRQARRDPELVLIEGFHALKHALRFGAQIVRAVITDQQEVQTLAAALAPELPAQLPADTPVIDPRELQRAGLKAPITGVMGMALRPRVDPQDMLADERAAPIVFLERPRGLGNIGWSVRTAAAADAAGVLTSGIHDPWCPTCVRIGAGLQFALPVARLQDDPLSALCDSDRPLIAVDTGGEPMSPERLPDRAILAFGTERHGLSPQLLERAQARVRLPMREGVSSLNLATSVAALLYGWRLRAVRRELHQPQLPTAPTGTT